MRRLVTVLLVGSLFAATADNATAGTSPKATKPARVVREWVADFNHGDATAAAAHFAVDSTNFTPLGGCDPCVGRSAMEEKFRGAIAAGTHLSVGRARVKGNHVTVRTELRAATLPPGVERAIGVLRATVKKGVFVRTRIVYDLSDPQTAALLSSVSQSPAP